MIYIYTYTHTDAGDMDSIPRSERSPGEGNGNPFQYSCLENSMDRGAWQAIVHEVVKSRTLNNDNIFHNQGGQAYKKKDAGVLLPKCIYINHFAAEQKLAQHCGSNTIEKCNPQKKKKKVDDLEKRETYRN